MIAVILISKYVFLGKSLVRSLIVDSGQNPIEPARLGCKIFHGPNVSNFTEIYDYLKTLDITRKINNSIESGPNAVFAFSREGYRKSIINFKEFFTGSCDFFNHFFVIFC